MQTSEPTRGQLERTLAQRIEALYRQQLGHRPGKIICHIFDEKIAIILEESITQPEQLLAHSGQEKLAEQVRLDLDRALQPRVTEAIEEIIGITVTDLLSEAKIETGRTGMIAVLAATPQTRPSNAESRPRRREPDSDDGEA